MNDLVNVKCLKPRPHHPQIQKWDDATWKHENATRSHKYIYKVQWNEFHGSFKCFIRWSTLAKISAFVFFFCLILFDLDAVNPVLSLNVKKISRLKCIKRQKQLGVFCLFAILHINLRRKKKKSKTDLRVRKPVVSLSSPSLKGSVSLHLEVSGDPQGLWGQKYSYWNLLVKKKHYKNAALERRPACCRRVRR